LLIGKIKKRKKQVLEKDYWHTFSGFAVSTINCSRPKTNKEDEIIFNS